MSPTLRSTGRSVGRRRAGRAVSLTATAIIVGFFGASCGSEESSTTGTTDGASSSLTQQEAGSTVPEPSRTGSTIEGSITIDGLEGPVPISGLNVRLQDVSRADASSQTVAEVAIGEAEFSPGQSVRFSVDVPGELDVGASYVLSAHADLDGSGDISVGDYITMESNPVVVDGSQGSVDLVLRLVSS